VKFILRNPNDPKYAEFHDGENEYWPIDGAAKSKSIKNPAAAVANGLELLGALLAAGLLAVVVTVMYVLTTPVSITENSAVINTNVYNNSDNQAVYYTLSTDKKPDNVLREGSFTEGSTILHLENLFGGTTYLLKYYDEGANEIGEFWFFTPGDPPAPGESEPPASGQPEQPTEPTVPSEPEDTTEPSEPEESTEPSEPEETTQPTEEIPTEPEGPGYIPPAPGPGPTPRPTEPEPTEPEPTETTPTEPTDPTPPEEGEFRATDPDIGAVTYVKPEFSGDEIKAYFMVEQNHVFLNVPEGNYTITVVQGGITLEASDYTAELEPDRTLRVVFTGGLMPVGRETITTVTVTTASGTETSTLKLTPPSLGEVNLTVAKTGTNTYTFTIQASVVSDGTQEMDMYAELYVNTADDTGVRVTMIRTASTGSVDTYTGTYTCSFDANSSREEAFVDVYGYWAMIGEGVYRQNSWDVLVYTP